MILRKGLVYLLIVAFMALAIDDTLHGAWRTGIASALLSVVNLLLLGV